MISIDTFASRTTKAPWFSESSGFHPSRLLPLKIIKRNQRRAFIRVFVGKCPNLSNKVKNFIRCQPVDPERQTLKTNPPPPGLKIQNAAKTAARAFRRFRSRRTSFFLSENCSATRPDSRRPNGASAFDELRSTALFPERFPSSRTTALRQR